MTGQRSGHTVARRTDVLLRCAGHPYFAGLQAHPEFCTRPLNPSPAFLGFIAASSGCLEEQIQRQKNYVPPVSVLMRTSDSGFEHCQLTCVWVTTQHPESHLKLQTAPSSPTDHR